MTETIRGGAGDTWKAAGMVFDAFLEDPLNVYLRAGQKPSRTLYQIISTSFLRLWMQTKWVLTVDSGTAIIVATPPESCSKNPIDAITNLLSTLLTAAVKNIAVKESRKRNKEFARKSEKVISETLGDRVREMAYVNLLATDPHHQGRGYGGALLESITRIADASGEALWLQSSNTNNTSFYMSHGFRIVGEVCLGDSNSKWNDKPIIVPIMVREPTSRFETEKAP
uniref:N-acetyltransferase domain-containing protein n=1 Tax=Psilocybe cubensis TaxID=181762 RepID=A0A8H7Y1B9_PSICU